MSASYFVGSALVGQGHYPIRNGGSHSIAYFCQGCGEVWGRVLTDESPSHWDTFNVPCERHPEVSQSGVPSWLRVPGSLLYWGTTYERSSTMFWAACLEALPLPVLEREFHLHLKFKEWNDTRQANTAAGC